MGHEISTAPIFIVSGSRSGSTLLRYVLDSHAEVGCPPELHLGDLCRALSWSQALVDEERKNSPAVLEKCRRTIDDMMSGYLARVSKSRWCEKSISTVDHLPLVRSIFPDAKFICLYRNCMDVVHSGLEVSKYGFAGYGFGSFVSRRPDNTVAALMDYWCDKVAKALKFEANQGPVTHRLRYEDLVLDPEPVIAELLQFLDLEADPELTSRIFAMSHQGGPGDSNIVFTREIERTGLGKGSTIPFRQIPDDQRERANGLLAKLGYPVIDEHWDRAPSPYSTLEPVSPARHPVDEAGPVSVLARLCQNMGTVHESGTIRLVFDDGVHGVWRLVLADGAAHAVAGDSEADCEVQLTFPALIALSEGRANPMKLIHAGELRIVGDGDLVRRTFKI